MELKNLTGAIITLILIAILVGIGLTVLGQLSTESRIDTAYTSDRFNATNESCTALTNSAITTTSATFINSSGTAVSSACFAWDATGRRAGSCVLLVSSAACSGVYRYTLVNASYTYGAATTASTSTATAVTAIGGFATWFTVLVVIISAAIIIGLVMRSFGGSKNN
jgi:hypothetical protein